MLSFRAIIPDTIEHSFPFQQGHSPPCRGYSAQISIIVCLVIASAGCDIPIEQVSSPINGSRSIYLFIVADLSPNRFQRKNFPPIS